MRIRPIAVAVSLLAAGGALAYAVMVVPSLTGFQAKTICSGIFVAHRNEAEIYARDIAPLDTFMGLVSRTVDPRGEVRADVLGLGAMRAIHRPGQGCAIDGNPAHKGAPAGILTGPDPLPTAYEPWAMRAAEQVATREGTRAVLVLREGTVIAELYRGTRPETPQLGWSMAKSITGLLAGQLYDRGRLSLDAAVASPPWGGAVVGQRPAFRHLLTMTAGLPADDGAAPLSPVVKMLYRNADIAGFASGNAFAPVAVPGEAWAYSSADTNILSAALRDLARPGEYERLAAAFFAAAGVKSATFETDAAGTLTGSTFLYAAPRDWARMGMLVLDGGTAGSGRARHQVVSREWLDFAATPVPASRGQYGAQIWLNRDPPGGRRKWPAAPADTMAFSGQFGQLVAIIPSRRLVVVRMGLTRDWDFDRDPDAVLRAFMR